MIPKRLDGNAVARAIKHELGRRLAALDRRPGLAVVLLKAGAASRKYAESKVKACREMGMDCTVHDFTDDLRPDVLHRRVRSLASDPGLHGLFVEHPLPADVDPIALYACIPAEKDVEGISYENLGRLLLGRPAMVASTAAACMAILDHYEVPIARRHAVVVGRSNIVGKPLWALLVARDATVTTCHSKTPDLAAETSRADILVVSVGHSRLIGREHVREGAIVVDVGINFEGGKMVGDVDFDAVHDRVSAITPVPGGVGPVTTAMLLSNLVETTTRQVALQRT